MNLSSGRALLISLEKSLPSPLLRVGWTTVILFTYFVLKEFVELFSSNLSEDDYFNATFVLSALGAALPLVIPIVFVLGYLALKENIGFVAKKWNQFENGRELNRFTIFVLGILVWNYALYDFNLYYDHGHYIERLLLIAFGLGAVRYPVLLLPFIWILIAIIGQFKYPFGIGLQYPLDDLLIRCLLLVSSWFLVSILTGRKIVDGLFVLVVSLIAGYYFGPGIGKIKVDWLEYNQVGLFAVAAYAHGWMSFISVETLERIVKFLLDINPALLIFTLVVELGGLFILTRKAALTALIVLWTAFHLGVFLLSGYLFWEWVVIEWALWFYFFRWKDRGRMDVFRKEYVLLSMILIFWCQRWATPPRLSWFDTGLDYNYQLEATLKNGEVRKLTPDIFSPYRDIFSFSNFQYLSDKGQLLRSYGATGNRELARSIYEASSPMDISELERNLPPRPVMPMERARFIRFIERFFMNLPKRLHEKEIFHFVQPLPVFWTVSRDFEMADLVNTETVAVIRVVTYFDGERIEEIESGKVLEIEIGDGS